MRLGVFADVHANLPALEATVDAFRRLTVDQFVHLGDLVGYGPFPNECIELVRDLDAVGVAGNHELIVRGQLSTDRCTRTARESLQWTAANLTNSARTYIACLPDRLSVQRTIVATHASLDDPQAYVETNEQADRQLELLARDHPGATTLLIGHTHRPRAYALRTGARRPFEGPLSICDQHLLLNPGSVGQPRGASLDATCLLLDLEARTAIFVAVEYDAERTRRELRRNGLDPRSLQPPASRMAIVRRAARRLAGARG